MTPAQALYVDVQNDPISLAFPFTASPRLAVSCADMLPRSQEAQHGMLHPTHSPLSRNAYAAIRTGVNAYSTNSLAPPIYMAPTSTSSPPPSSSSPLPASTLSRSHSEDSLLQPQSTAADRLVARTWASFDQRSTLCATPGSPSAAFPTFAHRRSPPCPVAPSRAVSSAGTGRSDDGVLLTSGQDRLRRQLTPGGVSADWFGRAQPRQLQPGRKGDGECASEQKLRRCSEADAAAGLVNAWDCTAFPHPQPLLRPPCRPPVSPQSSVLQLQPTTSDGGATVEPAAPRSFAGDVRQASHSEVSLSRGLGETSESDQGQRGCPPSAERPGREHNDHPPPLSPPLADVAEDVKRLASGFALARQSATGATASFAATKSGDDGASGGADAVRSDGDGGGEGVEIFFFSSCSVSDESQSAAAATSPRKPASAISGLPPAWPNSRSPLAVPPPLSSSGFALPSSTALGPRQLQMRLAKRRVSLDLLSPSALPASSTVWAPQSSSVTSASSAPSVSLLSPPSLRGMSLQEAAAAGDQVATTKGSERLRVASGMLGEGSEDSARTCDAEKRVQPRDAAVAPPPDSASTCADVAAAANAAPHRSSGAMAPNSRKVRLSLDSAAPQERGIGAEKAAGSKAPLKSALKGSSRLASSEKRKQLRPRLSLDSSGRAAAASATSKVKEGKEMRSASFPVSSLVSLPESATRAASSHARGADGGDSSCRPPSPMASSPSPSTMLEGEAAQKPKSILVKCEKEKGGKGRSSGGKVRFQKTVDVIVFA